MDFSYTIWIAILPFLAFAINGLGSEKLPQKTSGWIATVAIGISAFLSYKTAIQYFSSPSRGGIIAFKTTWLRFNGTLHIDLGILLDPISVMMLVVITTVSLMVFVYSMGYMKNERGYDRYFSFLSLFSFSMLGLVVATNLFQMYMFWELVGISSYLLIGFYYDKPSAVAASKKAFIVTRFADLGFLIGILLVSSLTGTFDFGVLTRPEGLGFASAAPFLGLSTITWALLLIFMGGAGKSAMFPLHIWLPDAMEGPTPVSALIHAATMVVAGVFLVARLFPLYTAYAPGALEVVAFVGAFTTLFAAVIACTQYDIKRILAFSTISQIGYMILALGVSGHGGEAGLGYMASLFHLFTHAFFKALLFLGAGAIIHAVHTNDIREMGNLRKHQPITHVLFLIACLAISGIPPFAGFFSKDEVLSATAASHPVYFAIAMGAAALTAFYMFRLYFIVFWGEERAYPNAPKEAPFIMLGPMMVLAVGSAFAGFIPFGHFISSDGVPLATHIHWPVAITSMAMALVGTATAWRFYKSQSGSSEKAAKALGSFHTSAANKFYIDEAYIIITKGVIFKMVSKPLAWIDRNVIDAFMDLLAAITHWASRQVREFQSGQLQKYAFIFIGGVIIIVLSFIYAAR
ncbi:MAG: NADH-quinone oxidoreductase subunit L [Cyclobacteriaceae bacterium]|nr:NADH-quinone oxidoreductase subunit L [Cyclobacteriaceae bacterium]MCB0498410.1 NADH-quinone oxidoreductase subunit L [Cyclobacteriaceae bacterium]MCB9237020.1 NADH-quinone oxidoreductase subunit L [Flammeovirgaceae bacterium]MCO5271666.1 NADH-quinone oxidoreductase subunit L [Cyclobacteriaceae bacterium]MCW5901270.1 NADH-quinone oxidoreductase subunit L [Cyclobacteriaceae bacterium]